MSEVIAFTKKHEKLLLSLDKKCSHDTVELHRHGIELHKLGVLMGDQNHKAETMLEILTHIQTRFNRQDLIEYRIDNHEHRISAIKSTLKQ